MRMSLNWLRRAVEAESSAAPEGAPPPLDYPLFPAPRVAVLGAVVRQTPGVVCYPQWTCHQLSRARPMALAGPFHEISAVAGLMDQGFLELPELRFPLLVFSPPSAGPLTEQQHERLWRWFRLPVFEQIRAPGGALLAYECDAREGFHVAPGADTAELGGVLLSSECGCGSRVPRLRLNSARVMAAAGG